MGRVSLCYSIDGGEIPENRLQLPPRLLTNLGGSFTGEVELAGLLGGGAVGRFFSMCRIEEWAMCCRKIGVCYRSLGVGLVGSLQYRGLLC